MEICELCKKEIRADQPAECEHDGSYLVHSVCAEADYRAYCAATPYSEAPHLDNF